MQGSTDTRLRAHQQRLKTGTVDRLTNHTTQSITSSYYTYSGLTFVVLAHPGSPGQRAAKRVCVCTTPTLICILLSNYDVEDRNLPFSHDKYEYTLPLLLTIKIYCLQWFNTVG